jgi:hypothetical protein
MPDGPGPESGRAVQPGLYGSPQACWQADRRTGGVLLSIIFRSEKCEPVGGRKQPGSAGGSPGRPPCGHPNRAGLAGTGGDRGPPRPQRHRPVPRKRHHRRRLRSPDQPRRRPALAHPRASPERHRGPGRPLVGPGLPQAVRPCHNRRPAVPRRPAGGTHSATGRPLAAGRPAHRGSRDRGAA